jgi:IclR family acetate operon transcriptional repressor
VVSRIDIRGAARAEMEELARATGETVHLARLELPNVLFIDCVESSKAMRVVSRVGQAMPAHCTSVGKAMLVHVEGAHDGYYKDQRLPSLTPNSISSRAKLDQALQVVRRQGYATSSEESEDGVGSVGVAILDRPGRLLGGLSIAAPTARMAPEVATRFAAEMKRAAEAIGFALG